MFLISSTSVTQIFLVAISIVVVSSNSEGSSCVREYDRAPGICKGARDCRRVREDYRSRIPLTICGYQQNNVPIVCCPIDNISNQQPYYQTYQTTETTPTRRISEIKCQEYAKLTKDVIFVNPLTLSGEPYAVEVPKQKCTITTPLIFGGVPTQPGEFPHMALLGRYDRFGEKDFVCGGSLISERYVLTAAHCKPKNNPPTFVRLSEQNIAIDTDTKHIDVDIENFIIHENYGKESGYKFDIGLIRLANNVTFSDILRPACLWQTPEIYGNGSVIAAGWGRTETSKTSNELQKVSLEIVGKYDCHRLFENFHTLRGYQVNDDQICAGGENKDTCQGDSGGPIMITKKDNDCLFYVVGLTSFGAKECALEKVPAVYTRVSSYLDWIEDHVWPYKSK